MPHSTDIKDYYRRAWGLGDRASFKYGGSWADWEANFSDQMTFEEYLRMDLKEKKPHFLDEKADGGRIGYNVAGLVAPALSSTALRLLATAGITAAAAQKMATENPTMLNNMLANLTSGRGELDPSQVFKSVRATGLGDVIGPDAAEIDREKERMKELLKPGKTYVPENKGWVESYPDVKPEKWTPPVNIPPQIKTDTGTPIPEQKTWKEHMLTFAQDKKAVKKKLDNIEPYGGADVIGKSTKKDRTKDIEFLEAFELFKNTHFGGNESAASKAINESRERIRAIKNRTWGENRRTGKVSTVHEEIITTEVPENPIRYIDATTAVKKDQNYFKNFLTKENKNDYLSAQNIANTLNFKFLDKFERDQFARMLNQLEVKKKEVPGKRYDSFKLSDVVNKLTEWNKRKRVKGESFFYTERRKIENKLDPDLYSKVFTSSKRRTNSILESQNLKMNLKIKPGYAVDDVGHPISIQVTDKFPKLFKKSDVNKINSLVNEDPLINQAVKKVTGYETRYTKFFKELEGLVGKDITAADRKKLIKIRKGMEENYLGLIDNISSPKKLKVIINYARPDLTVSDEYIKYLTDHTNRIARIDIKIPKVGEKFKSEDIFADMSKVDKRHIVGYVDKINPNARQFKDLSRSEKETYEANVLAQNAEIVGDFYRKLGFSENEIKELKDDFYYPTTKYKIRKAGGGPVGLSGVDQYILNRYK